jgi:hypothetical protein
MSRAPDGTRLNECSLSPADGVGAREGSRA